MENDEGSIARDFKRECQTGAGTARYASASRSSTGSSWEAEFPEPEEEEEEEEEIV